MADKKLVSAGKPKIGGAIYRAPIGTALPTDTESPLNEAFKNLGYCGEDGLSNSFSGESEAEKAWGGDDVLNAKKTNTDKFKFKLLESLNEEVLKTVFTDANVTGTLSTGVTVKVNGAEQEPKAWVVEMIMNKAIKRIVIPSASVTEVGEIVYKDGQSVGYEITLSASKDEQGNSHYEYIKETV